MSDILLKAKILYIICWIELAIILIYGCMWALSSNEKEDYEYKYNICINNKKENDLNE